MLRPFLFSVAAMGSLVSAAPSAVAQDASFGCKVLLCAAATAPSWSGIPYCVPVMTQLFRMLARGRPWPTCPEGNAGGLGYEPYLPCPAPGLPYSLAGEGGGYVPDANGGLCADPARIARECVSSGDNGSSCDQASLMTPRPQRAEPNYVDITSGGQTTRLYFSLRGY